MPALLGLSPRRRQRRGFTMNRKAMPTTTRLMPMPISPVSSSLRRPRRSMKAMAIRGGEHIDAADRPRGHRRLRRLRDKAGGGKDLVGIVDDRVDAGDLLEDSEPDPDHQRTPPFAREDLAPGGAVAFLAQSRLDGVEAWLEVDARANLG